ncbi:hypothetical protein HYT57_03380 [Candidatus Woesearchaeota archaeon]|nr:hypothetical protein [Candidatus Woesearchaeota archaeon]
MTQLSSIGTVSTQGSVNHNSNGLESTALLYTPSVEYYREILARDYVIEQLARRGYDFNIDDIASEQSADLGIGGTLNRRTHLKKVVLRDAAQNTLPLRIFLKIASEINLGTDASLANRHHELSDSMLYQYEQMRLWNSLGLPTPIVFGLDTVNHQRVTYYQLAMESWDGSTHDLNLLALRELGNRIRGSRKTYGPDEQAAYLRQLDEEKSFIVNSSLNTVRAFHIIGTEGLRNLTKLPTLGIFCHDDVEEYFLRKRAINYASQFYRYTHNMEKDESVPRLFLEKTVASLVHLVEPFRDESRYVYAQGDEYPQHFQFFSGFNGNRLSGIFDADHAMMTIPVYSYAKLLTSSLLNLTFEEELSYLSQVFSFEHPCSGGIYPSHLFGNLDMIQRDYVLTSLLTRFFNLGKKAADTYVHPQHHLRYESGISYSPGRTRFPIRDLIPVSVSYPSADYEIETQKKALETRLEIYEPLEFLNRQDLRAISEFKRYLTNNNLL